VRITRTGTTVSGYRSADGITWTLVASDTVSFSQATIYAGLAVTAHTNAAVSTATFTNVSLTGAITTTSSPVYARGYVYGDYVDEVLAILPASGLAADRKLVHSNHLYSVAALTDNSGNVVERYRYDAYGQRTVLAADGTTVRAASSYGNQIGFQGRYHNKETGLIYYRTRAYSPILGRFLDRMPWWGFQGRLRLAPYYMGYLPSGIRNFMNREMRRSHGNYVQRRYSLYDFEFNNPANTLEPFSLGGVPSIDLGNGTSMNPWTRRVDPNPPPSEDPPLGTNLPDPYGSCLAEGSYRHCVNSCVLARNAPDIIVQPVAQAAGGDLPWQDTRDEGDVDANQAGIDMADDPGSCTSKCRTWFDQEVKRKCCPENIRIYRTDPRCWLKHPRNLCRKDGDNDDEESS
jgi:RHS repeat-associated protein